MWNRPFIRALKAHQTQLPTRTAVHASILRCTDSSLFPKPNSLSCNFNTSSDVFRLINENAAAFATGGRRNDFDVGFLRTYSTQAKAVSSVSTAANSQKNESNGINTIKLVKLLRERTAVSMGLCKQALEASNWDMEEAVRYLRKAGIKRAVQTAERDAHEGLVAICNKEDGSSSSAIVLSCETDFVQRNPKFISFAKALAEHYASLSVIGEGGGSEIDLLNGSKPSSNLCALAQCGVETDINSVNELFPVLTSQFGEKVIVATAERLDGNATSCIGSYVHNEVESNVGRVAALIQLNYEIINQEKNTFTTSQRKQLIHFAKLLAMQVVATKPKFICFDSIPFEYIQQERGVIEQAAIKRASANAKKPDLAKIVEKNLEQSLKEQCLLSQEFLMTMQMNRDILNANGINNSSSNQTQNVTQNSTVADALKRFGESLGCKLQVTQMRLLNVGNN